MTHLTLTIPPREMAPEPGIDDRPHAVAHWLEQLPYVSADDTEQRIRRRLHLLNRQPMSTQQRSDLMECFHEAYQRLHEHLITRTFTMEEPRQDTDLTREMSYGYKIIISEQLARKLPWGRRRHLPLALFRGLHYIGLEACHDYHAYRPGQPHLWQEAVELYHQAEAFECAAQVLDDDDQPAHAVSIADEFMALAMLRLSDPYRFPTGRVWDVYGYLSLNAHRLRLETPRADTRLAGIFPLDLGVGGQTDARRLNCRLLIKAVQLDMDHLLSGTSPRKLGLSGRIGQAESLQLFQRLLTLWVHTPERTAPRFAGRATVEMVAGFQAVYSLGGDSPDLGQEHRVLCERINRSSGGLAMRGSGDCADRVRVGQLVAVRTADAANGPVWIPAMVRWLQRPDDDMPQWGLQYIGEGLEPCLVRPENGEQEPLAALATELSHDGKHLHILIAPTGIFAENRRLVLIKDNETLYIRCTQLLETATPFDRFCYVPATTTS